MDKERFSKLLLEQKEKGRSLIALISTMHETQNDFGDGMAMFGGEDLYYVPEDELDGFLNKFEGWKSYMSDLLKTQFGVDDQFVTIGILMLGLIYPRENIYYLNLRRR